ncbi:MAG: imidazole glycerol phosphate synthase subunit HisH [Candidatus Omnitrophota bacterium]
MIVILDYGMGNLRSVEKGFEQVGFEALISSKPADLEKADAIVLPGVGAFADAMEELRSRKLIEPIKDNIKHGKPFLGLCLGMQLLFTKSYEGSQTPGLGILEGEVKKFKGDLKIPHMGWNQIEIKNECRILKDIPEDSYFYFVHSYYAEPKDKSVVAAWTDYGGEFASVVCRDNIFATQFHPEKSQELGLKILKNFGELC